MGIYREGKTGPSFFGQVAKEGKGGEASGLFGGSPKKCRLVNNIREAEGRGRSYLRPGEESWPSPFLSISGRSLPSRGPGALGGIGRRLFSLTEQKWTFETSTFPPSPSPPPTVVSCNFVGLVKKKFSSHSTP